MYMSCNLLLIFSLSLPPSLSLPLSPSPPPPPFPFLSSLPPSPSLPSFSYMVSVGLIDRLGDHFNTIVGPIGETELTQLVLGGLNLLVATTACMHTRYYMYILQCMCTSRILKII